MDGDWYTDYWSEVGSDTWGFIADNGTLNETNSPKGFLSFDNSFLIYSMNGVPPAYRNVPRRHFDRFRRHQRYQYKVLLGKEIYSTSLEKFKQFSQYRQKRKPIAVDFWYFYVRNVRPLGMTELRK